MKQTVILLVGFLLVNTVLFAQEKHPRFLTELSVGPSFPIGKFADKLYHDQTRLKPSGLAKTGWVANFSLGYYLNRSVGLLLSAGYSDHKQDMSKYGSSFYGPAFDPLPGLEFKGTNWEEVNVRAGAFFVVPLTANHRFNLVTKLTAGICKTAAPAYNWKSYYPPGTVFAQGTVSKIDLPWGFCYQADVALKYKLGDHLQVLLNFNSFKANLKKDFSGSYPNAEGEQRQYNLNTVNAMAGIGFDF